MKPKKESVEESFNSPESSQVVRAIYNKRDRTMLITFKSGKYLYHEIPYDLWEDFKAADSKGEFVNSRIVVDRKHPLYIGVRISL